MALDPALMTCLGVAASIFFSALGSALASVQGGRYAMRSTGVISFAPIMSSGVLAIYGIIVSVLLSEKIQVDTLDAAGGYRNFSAGLSVGLASLASGMGLAGFFEDSLPATTLQVADSTSEIQEPLIRGSGDQRSVVEKPSPRFLMCMIFLEAIGLYGLIVALVLIGK